MSGPAQVNNVKVVRPRARLEVARVGHSEVEARGAAVACSRSAAQNPSCKAAQRTFRPQRSRRTGLPSPLCPQVRWSAGAVPPLPSGVPSWRLSLDVAPVLEPGETDDVIGDVFVAAANAGLFVHTLEGRRVLFDVTPSEATERCKRIPLLPRRTYHVALVRARVTCMRRQSAM